MGVLLSPVFNENAYQDEDGNPLAGGKIFTYEAGSFSTELTSYTSADGMVENTNPLILDSSGRQLQPIWLLDNEAYNIVLTLPDGTTVVTYRDDVTGTPIPTTSGGGSDVIWNVETDLPTYINATTFVIAGNLVVDFAVGNRVKFTISGNVGFGTVTAVAFSNPNTQVTLQLDSISMDSSLSSVAWSSLIAAGPTVDAGGVSYSDSLTYSGTNTVGARIKTNITNIATLTTNTNSLKLVTTTTGTTPTFLLNLTPAAASYSANQVFNVKFNGAVASGASTLNVNSLGALGLKQYDINGNKVDAKFLSGQSFTLLYDGTDLILNVPQVAAATNAPYWGYYNAAAQSSNGTVNYQSFNTAAVGVTSYTSGVVTVGTAGKYLITASFTTGYTGGFSGATGTLTIYQNGSPAGIANQFQENNNTVEISTVSATAILDLAANDTVSIQFDRNNAQIFAGTGSFTGIRIA